VKKPEQVEKVEQAEKDEGGATPEGKQEAQRAVKTAEQMGRALMMGQLMTQAFDTLMSGGDIAKKIGDSGYGKKAGSEILGQISQKLGAEQKETKESVKGLESAVGELQGVVDGLKEKLEGLKGELEGLGKEKQAAEGTPQQEEKEGAFQAKSKEVDDTSGELQAKTAELEGMTDQLEGAKEKLGNLGVAKQKIDDAKQNLGKSNYLDGVKDVSDLASKICQATADVAISMMAQQAGSHDMRAGLIKSLASAIGDMIQTSKSTPELQSAMTGAKNLKAFSTVTTAAKDGHTRMAKENFALKKEGGEQATQAPPQRPQRPAQTARPQASEQTQQAAKPQGTQGAKNFEGFSKTQQPGTGNVKLTKAQGKSFSLQQGSITQTNAEA
ncbi:MAG: hypothetical protein KDK48_02730, partial [Chlamydiia bacterium]|nr:hypothetical protein [Chlamydiia bacterium]